MNRIPLDYDADPERFRANVKAVVNYGLMDDVHEEIAERFLAEKLEPILDLGCGEGRFLEPARDRGLAALAFDYSNTMLQAVDAPRIQGDARYLPFAVEAFGGVTALYMLYHLEDPLVALAESHRVMRAGGLFVACAPSRHNDPELAAVLPQSRSTFDAENGEEMLCQYFQDVEVERWDAPLVHLPDEKALELYLRGRQLPVATTELALQNVQTPLTLTKRGALFYGYKDGTI